jgi:cytochrome b
MLLVIVSSGIAMSGPPPADPTAAQSERGENGEGENHDEELLEGRELSARVPAGIADLVIPPARADEAEEGDRGEGKGDELFEEVHEVAVNLLYLLIALHIAGVIFETRRSGREIVGAMIPGGNRRD